MVTSSITNIHELLSADTIRVQLPGNTKEEVLEQLIGLLAGQPGVRDFEEIRRAVWEREAVMSTGVGKGLALPHAKTAAVSDIVAAFATTEVPIEYDAIDDQPVRLIFLMVSTENARTQHIKLLSRISRLMNDAHFREHVLQAQNPEELIDLIQQNEALLQ